MSFSCEEIYDRLSPLFRTASDEKLGGSRQEFQNANEIVENEVVVYISCIGHPVLSGFRWLAEL